MEIIAIIVIAFIVSILCFFIGRKTGNKTIEDKNNQIKKENDKLIQEQNVLKAEQKQLQEEKYEWLQKAKESETQFKVSQQAKLRELDNLDNQINDKRKIFNQVEERTKLEQEKTALIQKEYQDKLKTIENAKQLAEDAASERRKNLEEEYNKQKTNYELNKKRILQEIEEAKQDLESIKETRAAAIQSRNKEILVEENKDEYCLILPKEEERDIAILRDVQYRISKPRAVAMCIWSNYYLPIAKEKLPKILGKNNITGIYKLTNQRTKECYIGQAIDVKKRIYEHMRAGLGVDTPQGNQLYQAMKEDGIENFSIELLEECSGNKLDKKEKYYIELYQSQIYGYNISPGNKSG